MAAAHTPAWRQLTDKFDSTIHTGLCVLPQPQVVRLAVYDTPPENVGLTKNLESLFPSSTSSQRQSEDVDAGDTSPSKRLTKSRQEVASSRNAGSRSFSGSLMAGTPSLQAPSERGMYRVSEAEARSCWRDMYSSSTGKKLTQEQQQQQRSAQRYEERQRIKDPITQLMKMRDPNYEPQPEVTAPAAVSPAAVSPVSPQASPNPALASPPWFRGLAVSPKSPVRGSGPVAASSPWFRGNQPTALQVVSVQSSASAEEVSLRLSTKEIDLFGSEDIAEMRKSLELAQRQMLQVPKQQRGQLKRKQAIMDEVLRNRCASSRK